MDSSNLLRNDRVFVCRERYGATSSNLENVYSATKVKDTDSHTDHTVLEVRVERDISHWNSVADFFRVSGRIYS